MLHAHNRTLPAIRIPESAAVAIRLWRAHLTWAEVQSLRGRARGRLLECFADRAPVVLLEMDGSLIGVGCRLFALEGGDSERLLGHASVGIGDGLRGDSSYQNAMELMAVVWGLAALGQLGYRDCCIRIRGDSRTILEWTCSTRGAFQSVRARSPVIAFVAVCGRFGFSIDRDPQWIAGEVNVVCDGLSRLVSVDAELVGPRVTLVHGDRLQQLCHPRNIPVGVVGVTNRFREVIEAFAGRPK
jgi:hypothetical protein